MVYIVLADGFEDVEALAPRDLLLRGGVEVRMVSVSEKNSVSSAKNLTVEADLLFSEIGETQAEAIILPGGMPGAKHLNTEKIHAFLRNQQKSTLLCAICAAPMVLGDAGLLQGKKAICYPGFEEHLQGAILTKKPVVRDDEIITAVGMGASMEFGLEILAALKGEKVAEQVKDSIFYS